MGATSRADGTNGGKPAPLLLMRGVSSGASEPGLGATEVWAGGCIMRVIVRAPRRRRARAIRGSKACSHNPGVGWGSAGRDSAAAQLAPRRRTRRCGRVAPAGRGTLRPGALSAARIHCVQACARAVCARLPTDAARACLRYGGAGVHGDGGAFCRFWPSGARARTACPAAAAHGESASAIQKGVGRWCRACVISSDYWACVLQLGIVPRCTALNSGDCV